MSHSSSRISIAMPPNIQNRLQNLALIMERSKATLIKEAIDEYLDLHEWQIQAIHAGLQDIEEGKHVDFLEIKKQWKQ